MGGGSSKDCEGRNIQGGVRVKMTGRVCGCEGGSLLCLTVCLFLVLETIS